MYSLFYTLLFNLFAGICFAEAGDQNNRGALSNSTGCDIDTKPILAGFDATFYPYQLMKPYDEPYVSYGYKDHASLGTVKGVTDITFNIDLPAHLDYTTEGTVYGFPITVSNFSLQLTGYFFAAETGYYEVLFYATDDAVVFYFGTDSAFECCHSDELSNRTDFQDQVIYTTGNVGDDGRDFYASRFRYLEGGYYYPTRIAYTQIVTFAYLNLTITTPSGQKLRTFGDTVFQFDEKNSNCQSINPFDPKLTTTTTIPWTGTETSTYTTTFSDPVSPIEVFIETPRTTTTTTQPWTGTVTSTTTATDTATSSPVTVIVETPVVVPSTLIKIVTSTYQKNITSTVIQTAQVCAGNQCLNVTSSIPTVVPSNATTITSITSYPSNVIGISSLTSTTVSSSKTYATTSGSQRFPDSQGPPPPSNNGQVPSSGSVPVSPPSAVSTAPPASTPVAPGSSGTSAPPASTPVAPGSSGTSAPPASTPVAHDASGSSAPPVSTPVAHGSSKSSVPPASGGPAASATPAIPESHAPSGTPSQISNTPGSPAPAGSPTSTVSPGSPAPPSPSPAGSQWPDNSKSVSTVLGSGATLASASTHAIQSFEGIGYSIAVPTFIVSFIISSLIIII